MDSVGGVVNSGGSLVYEALKELEDELGRDFDAAHSSIRSKVDYLPIEKEFSPVISWMIVGALLGPAFFLSLMLFLRAIRAVSVRQALFLAHFLLFIFFSTLFFIRLVLKIDSVYVFSLVHPTTSAFFHVALFSLFFVLSFITLWQSHRNRFNREGLYCFIQFGFQLALVFDYYIRVWSPINLLSNPNESMENAVTRIHPSIYAIYFVISFILLYITLKMMKYRKETNPLQEASFDKQNLLTISNSTGISVSDNSGEQPRNSIELDSHAE